MHSLPLLTLLPVAVLVGGATFAGATVGAQEASTRTPVRVIPQPVSVTLTEGAWRPARMVMVTTSATADTPSRDVAAFAAAMARETMGVSSAVGGGAWVAGGIHLQLDSSVAGAEAYRLTVGARGAEVRASAAAGLFHGVQTLRQLAMDGVRTDGSVTRVDGVRIDDAPRFPWRGLHLDVGRHFQPVAFVKRYIDLMALFKLNTFHWHLTEDQGWRIEIAKYPRLTEVGGCRAETMVAKEFDPYVGDRTPHCGFYTQDEVREVVAYAAARHVTVVPEIEMPGHSVAALAAYPELGCTPGPFTVRTTWGVDENILCPSERTFGFLEDVLTEVMALFPSRFIHIGGDEAPKDRWKASPLAQEVIRREGLKDEHELQSWFIRRIERFLNANGRRLIGWDEILEGGLAPQATVMSWRGTAGGIEAARQGHDVVMTPTDFLYLDYYQGDPRFEPLANGGNVPLEKVYSYEPVPTELTAAQARHILGAQGNVWTEYLKTPAAVEYQAYPRALALAEVTWSRREARDWTGFASRLPAALRLLDARAVNYRLPHVSGLDGDVLTLDAQVRVELGTALGDAQVRYTTDGTDPTATSTAYTGPFTLMLNAAGTRVTARAFTAGGKVSPPRAATFTHTTHRDADRVNIASLAAGLRYEYREGDAPRALAVDSLPVTRAAVAPSVARLGDERAERYAILLTGFIRVSADAMYTFALTSDDGSTLSIGDRLVVDNDGLHGAEEKQGMVALRAGLHPVTVRFFQAGGGAALTLRMRVGDGPWQPVPEAMLLHRPR